MSVEFHFTNVISKATLQKILAVLEILAPLTNGALDNLNVSSPPGWVLVAVEPNLIGNIGSGYRL